MNNNNEDEQRRLSDLNSNSTLCENNGDRNNNK
jgi:hypothetical protein